MGDRVWYIARPGPTPEDVDERVARLIAAMKAAGLIAGENDPDSVLIAAQGPAYRPGPRAEESLPPGYGRTSELRTNGAEFIAGAIFNWSPLNVDEFTAPCCGTRIDAGEIVDTLGTAAGVEKDFSATAVTCPHCGAQSGVNAWAGDGFLLAGCGVKLWNWQVIPEVLDPVRKLAREALGPELVEDGYKI
ncbi:hypothetical protein FHY55_20165 [Oceanicola sp. D3]|uniref:hypothetical protein n=1 Tax=Oceanicola sp. D3 TaxID=2587163 RepID=UPI0011238754|nr:hypothetical protein [Oceanicola sp. D3]QDC11402.1 hypothetical protein FHY55_20165 [Oceanicola sp. D3]